MGRHRGPVRRNTTPEGRANRQAAMARVNAARAEKKAADLAAAASTTGAPEVVVSTTTSTKARIEEAASAVKSATNKEVQAAIDKWAEKGDVASSQMDESNVKRTLANADRAERETNGDAAFDAKYEQASTTGLGYLQRVRGEGGRTLLVPPNCQIHPKLGAWGFLHRGRWLMIRWAYTGPKNRLNDKVRRGYQFFEGREWCDRLGLLPEMYLGPAGRISYGDLTLMWHTDAYVAKHLNEALSASRDMRQAVNEKLSQSAGGVVKGVSVIEGSDEDVMREVRARKESATGTRMSVVVP